jgi:NADH-quinone oxidoreductase subunit C
MKKDENKYIKEIFQLVKSLLTFCKYELTIKKNEITLNCSINDLTKILLFLKDNPSLSMECLVDITAVDFPENVSRFTIVYNLLSISKNFRLKVKVKASENELIPSINEIYSCAGWCEREIWDLFGIKFKDHPDLRRLLTDYDFEGHPLRKDFPLTGFTQVRYDNELSRVVTEPVKLDQEYRNFDNLSPWEGMGKYLPGDEKSDLKND